MKKNFQRLGSLFLISLLCTGCFQAYNNDDCLDTKPVTNNPNVVPSHGTGLPGMGSISR